MERVFIHMWKGGVSEGSEHLMEKEVSKGVSNGQGKGVSTGIQG